MNLLVAYGQTAVRPGATRAAGCTGEDEIEKELVVRAPLDDRRTVVGTAAGGPNRVYRQAGTEPVVSSAGIRAGGSAGSADCGAAPSAKPTCAAALASVAQVFQAIVQFALASGDGKTK